MDTLSPPAWVFDAGLVGGDVSPMSLTSLIVKTGMALLKEQTLIFSFFPGRAQVHRAQIVIEIAYLDIHPPYIFCLYREDLLYRSATIPYLLAYLYLCLVLVTLLPSCDSVPLIQYLTF